MAAQALTWSGEYSTCGRFALSRTKIRHGMTWTTEWEVIYLPRGKVVGRTGGKRDARKVAQRAADDIAAGRPLEFWDT